MTRLLFVLAFLPCLVYSQHITLNGYVKDASNGEALIGVTVYIQQISGGQVTNEYGFYSITLPAGNYDVQYSYIGFITQSRKIDLTQNQRMDIELVPKSEQLEEVVVQSAGQANANNLEMSTNKMDIQTILKVPSFLGESDVLRSLLLLPGVSTVGEGASGFNVRGGSVGQNLVLLDEAPIYNSSHLFGFFSVFNPDAVKDTKLYKGAIPSRYGGRLASFLDVRMKEGNSKKFEANGGIGTVFSRLSIEAPIIKDKASFIVAARRSYIDVLARPFTDIFKNGAALNFYDLTLKSNYSIDPKNRVYLSGYFGRDRFLFDKNQGFSWGNATSTIRWNHLYNDKLFSNVTLLYSQYKYNLQFGDNNKDLFLWNSSISNVILKPDFSYFINSNHELTFGGEAIYYVFEPANASGLSNGTPFGISLPRKNNIESSLFIGNSQKVSPSFSLDYGLRYSFFQYIGPGESYRFNDTVPGIRKPLLETIDHKRGEGIAFYNNLEPRLSFKWQTSENSSVKGSYNRMAQYLHLISNTTASNPLDIWVPTTRNIKPELGDQFTLGYFRDLHFAQPWEFSIEAYYRLTQNQVDYINGADLFLNKFIEADLLSGKGRAYGLEVYLQKKTGRWNGWVSYTLGRTELKVEGINQFKWYPTRYDQTHNAKVTVFYDLTKRMSLSGNFVLTTGTPTTFPTSRFMVQGILIPYNVNDSRNNVRLPSYHRLDISVRLEGRELKRGKPRKNHSYWVFSVYNVYGRKNPFSIYFSQSETRTPTGLALDTSATQLAIVGTVIPSISYNFKF